MRSKLFAILASLVIPALAVIILVFSAKQPNSLKNGFKRKFLFANPTQLAATIIPSGVGRINGFTGNKYYFTTDKANTLFVLDKYLKKGEVQQLILNSFLLTQLKDYFFMQTDSPWVYIYGFNIPAIVKYSLTTQETRVTTLDKGSYSAANFITPSTFVLRKVAREIKDQLFVKYHLISNTSQTEINLSDIRHDGGVSTDGILRFDPEKKILIYVNYFRNKYTCFDTNLKKVNFGSTIDTFSHYQFTTSGGEQNVFRNAEPDHLINEKICVDQGLLFVKSSVQSDNEKNVDFTDNDVIDIYDYTRTTYLGSFYLPKADGQSFESFQVMKNLLIAQYAGKIILYKLNNYFKF